MWHPHIPRFLLSLSIDSWLHSIPCLDSICVLEKCKQKLHHPLWKQNSLHDMKHHYKHWLNNFISRLKVVDSIERTLIIYCNNCVVILFSKKNKGRSQSKINIKFFVFKDHIKKNKIAIEYIKIKLTLRNKNLIGNWILIHSIITCGTKNLLPHSILKLSKSPFWSLLSILSIIIYLSNKHFGPYLQYFTEFVERPINFKILAYRLLLLLLLLLLGKISTVHPFFTHFLKIHNSFIFWLEST